MADLLCRWRQTTQNDNVSSSPPPSNPKRSSAWQERRVCRGVVAVSRSFDFQYSRTDGQHAICLFKLHATVVSGWIAPVTAQLTAHSLTQIILFIQDFPKFVSFSLENGKMFGVCHLPVVIIIIIINDGDGVDAGDRRTNAYHMKWLRSWKFVRNHCLHQASVDNRAFPLLIN